MKVLFVVNILNRLLLFLNLRKVKLLDFIFDSFNANTVLLLQFKILSLILSLSELLIIRLEHARDGSVVRKLIEVYWRKLDVLSLIEEVVKHLLACLVAHEDALARRALFGKLHFIYA